MLQPFLMGRLVAVHPLAIIFAITAGVVVAGVVGALIAVPLAACLNGVVRHLASVAEEYRGRTTRRRDPTVARTRMTDIHGVCLALPGAALTFPFGEETAVFKVGGKVFAITAAESPTHVTLKAEPEEVTGLVETYEAIIRGYHMNKKHWITVQVDGALPDGLVEELVEDSYDLVVDNLPARDRP